MTTVVQINEKIKFKCTYFCSCLYQIFFNIHYQENGLSFSNNCSTESVLGGVDFWFWSWLSNFIRSATDIASVLPLSEFFRLVPPLDVATAASVELEFSSRFSCSVKLQMLAEFLFLLAKTATSVAALDFAAYWEKKTWHQGDTSVQSALLKAILYPW